MFLLLDIDGVMVPANSWRKPEILADGFAEFNPKAVKALNKILHHHNFEIVLTTSHKFKYSLNQWLDIFKTRDIILSKIDRLPDNIDLVNRKSEILNWFNSQDNNDDFIILDDDKSLNDLPPSLKQRLVQTSASVGLTDDLADEVLELAEKSHREFA
ncbi:HAD domain-containing protein [Pedobacter jeongneungensis]|uniref:HAD domain-containing protein n=1 Tax=Pedobacter jeongneungensis TaxID=947309 RepID=UPI00046816A7|nr:HAD domain-containing protein [Pedobacter jeongneungensis]